MLATLKGTIQGNTIVVENEDLRPYDGTEVVVTLLGHPSMKRQKKQLTGIVFLFQAKGKSPKTFQRGT